MTGLAFAQPHWLAIGAIVYLGLGLLLVRADHLRWRAAVLLAGRRAVVTVGRGRRLAKRALLLLGTAAAFLALARPRWGYRWEAERRTGIDLMFAVDTSKSMRARDLAPDRLTRAKLAVSDLLREFPGERAGLIAFAGTAFVEAPMTLDQVVFGESLDALDTDIIPRGGTNIAAAIHTAVEAMASEPEHRKVLVILSDGENLEGDALGAAQAAARAGLVIYAVGVGTPAGELVPVDREGRPGVMQDGAGQPVRSRLDEPMLRRLAAATGGAYAALGPSGRGLETLYRQHLADLPRRTSEERMHKIWTERFQIPLGIAIGCLLLELALGERRRPRQRLAAPLGASMALLLLTGAPHPAAAASAPAANAPPGEHGATSTYNDGTAAYRKHDFAAAQQRFQSATHTTDLGLQEDAYYDLGNAHYRVGEAALAKSHDRASTIAAWKEALAAYDGALALQPKDADARFNRDLVTRRLAALEKEQNPKSKPDEHPSPQNQNGAGKRDQHGGQGQSAAQPNQSGGQGAQNQSGANGGGQPKPAEGRAGAQGQNGSTSEAGAQSQTSPAAGTGQMQTPNGTPSGAPTAPNDRSGAGRSVAEENGAARPNANQASRLAPAQPSPTPKGPGVVAGAADQTGAGDQADGKNHAPSERRDPGALTQGEAIQLLDSATGDMRRLPAAGNSRRPAANDVEPDKDW